MRPTRRGKWLARPPPPGATWASRMADLLAKTWRETVAAAPDAVALIDAGPGTAWTRRALDDAAAAWRANLPPGAALEGRRVVLVEPNGPGWWRAFLGLIRAGAIPAPLDATEPPEQQLAVARAIGAAWIWRPAGLEFVARRPRERRRELGLFKLTSGSTGAPRALGFTDAQMLADGRQVCRTMGIGPDDLNLAVIPFGHSYGLGNLAVPLLMQGTASLCAPIPLPQVLATECARWRPTVFPAVPALLRALVQADIAPAMLASLRRVISAGAPLAAEVAAAFEARFGRRVHGFYGTSETGGIAFDRSGEATREGRSVGTALDGVQLGFRRHGRLVVTSPAVMGRGSHTPPDRAEFTAAGELVLLGRTGRLVKIAARRIDLGEIERLLLAVPGVREAYAIAHPEKAEALAAAVAGTLAAGELRAQLRERAPAWKVPDRLVVLREFPLTARGKPDTRRLRALLGAGEADRGLDQGSTPKSK